MEIFNKATAFIHKVLTLISVLCLVVLIYLITHFVVAEAVGNKEKCTAKQPQKQITVTKQIKNNKQNHKVKYKTKTVVKTTKKYSVHKSASSFKTYMDYRCISLRSSSQYKLQQKSSSKTDSNGLRYTKINNIKFYHIALGSYYGSKIGDKYKVSLPDGKYFYGILADQKANCHTNSTNQYTIRNGDVIEFIVDQKTLNKRAVLYGDISAINTFKGKPTKIEKVKFKKIKVKVKKGK